MKLAAALTCLALMCLYFGIAWLEGYLKRTKPNRRTGLPAPHKDGRNWSDRYMESLRGP